MDAPFSLTKTANEEQKYFCVGLRRIITGKAVVTNLDKIIAAYNAYNASDEVPKLARVGHYEHGYEIWNGRGVKPTDTNCTQSYWLAPSDGPCGHVSSSREHMGFTYAQQKQFYEACKTVFGAENVLKTDRYGFPLEN